MDRIDVSRAVDGHAHLLAEPDYPARHLEAAAACGIERVVVSGLGPAWGMLDNAGVLAAAAAFPDRRLPRRTLILVLETA